MKYFMLAASILLLSISVMAKKTKMNDVYNVYTFRMPDGDGVVSIYSVQCHKYFDSVCSMHHTTVVSDKGTSKCTILSGVDFFEAPATLDSAGSWSFKKKPKSCDQAVLYLVSSKDMIITRISKLSFTKDEKEICKFHSPEITKATFEEGYEVKDIPIGSCKAMSVFTMPM